MARILEAVYEDGVLKLLEDPGLRDHERVVIEIKDRVGEQGPHRKSRTFGSAKGLITMAEDFDAPLEDFRDATATVKDEDVRHAILSELSAWHEVYEGLSEEEIAAIEAIVLDRGRSSRHEPE